VPILEKKVGIGILQGDSLSPLLFVLCIDPLSRQNKKVNCSTESVMSAANHLLFVDDLKLMVAGDEDLKMLMKETKEFFKLLDLK
jgi:Reverse transcriptase (RNA-dependent DNA polymerase)